PQPIVHLLFRHFVLTAPGGNTHPACPTLIHPFLPHQPALMTRHRRQPPTFVLERLSLGVTTPGRCGLFDAYGTHSLMDESRVRRWVRSLAGVLLAPRGPSLWGSPAAFCCRHLCQSRHA